MLSIKSTSQVMHVQHQMHTDALYNAYRGGLIMKNSTQDDSKRYITEKIHIFGRNMRMARKFTGLTTTLMGDFLNLSTAYIGLIERGAFVK